MEIFHLSQFASNAEYRRMIDTSSQATSLVVVRGSALMIALNWLLSIYDVWPLCSSSSGPTLQNLLNHHCTICSCSWAKCVVYVASCLCCFMMHLNSNKKKIARICFLS